MPAAEVVTAASAYAVVATWVLLLPAAAVGATGIPVRLAADIVGAVPKTASPVPVSSVIFPRSCAEVVAAKVPKLLEVVASIPVVGNVSVVAPVVVSVVENAPAVARVLPSARDKVATVPGSVITRSLIRDAVAVPSTGVTNVGDVANTACPDPVSSEITPANCAEVVAPNAPKLLVVVANVPVVGKVRVVAPVVVSVVENAPAVAKVLPSARDKVALVPGSVIVRSLILVAAATPNTGVTRVGDVPNTTRPEPVSSEIAPARPAEFTSKFSFNADDVVTAPST